MSVNHKPVARQTELSSYRAGVLASSSDRRVLKFRSNQGQPQRPIGRFHVSNEPPCAVESPMHQIDDQHPKIADLTKELNWMPHSTRRSERAATAGMRARPSTYRVASLRGAPAPQRSLAGARGY
jgi:hypothetical protein